MDIPNQEKTTSLSPHLRFMEAEVIWILMQRMSVEQLLTPKGYKICVYKAVCCHQKEPKAQ